MFDRQLLAVTKPVVDRIARALHARGFSANQISVAGFLFGVIAALMIASGAIVLAILPLLINRVCDGLDGALARLSKPSDRGAFLDITLDFFFYALVPLAFAFCDPNRNGLAAAVLLASFIGTGVTFLAYAIMATKRGEGASVAYPSKAFYYLGGLTEGFETVMCFCLMCLFPHRFVEIAFVYSIMCTVTIVTRMVAGWRSFD